MEVKADGLLCRMSGEPRVDAWVKWAQTQGEHISDDAVELGFGDDADVVKQFSLALHGDPTMHLGGTPCNDVDSLEQGNRLEALQVSMGRHEPRTQSKRACLNKNVITRHAKRVN